MRLASDAFNNGCASVGIVSTACSAAMAYYGVNPITKRKLTTTERGMYAANVGLNIVGGTTAVVKGTANGKTTVTELNKTKIENNFYSEGWSSSPAGLHTSSGIITSNPNKTTTVLGRWVGDMDSIIVEQTKYPKTENFGANPGGFNLLNIPDSKVTKNFWNDYNKPFLDEAIKRGDDIAIATIPKRSSDVLMNGQPTGMFGLEIKYLVEKNIKPVNIPASQWNTIKGWYK